MKTQGRSHCGVPKRRLGTPETQAADYHVESAGALASPTLPELSVPATGFLIRIPLVFTGVHSSVQGTRSQPSISNNPR